MLKLLLGLGLVSAAGCASQDIRQLGYFVVQNFAQFQCQQRMADDCKTSQNYDAYQRNRQAVNRD